MLSSDDLILDQPLSRFSTIRVGGIAKTIVPITHENQLLSLFNENDSFDWTKAIVIGAGSNVLFSDDGFSHPILLIRMDYANIVGETIEVGAGASLVKTAKLCGEKGLSGLEWACGIPSSIGGAVVMNAGAFSGSIADRLISCTVLREGKLIKLANSECGFGYRTSIFKHSRDIIVSAAFRLDRLDSAQIKQRMQKHLALRTANQPKGASLGSVFKNADKPAGYYIEQAGLKGLRAGDMYVSEKHANFIINGGKGSASDFLRLVDIIKGTVLSKFGVVLEEEFIKIGEF